MQGEYLPYATLGTYRIDDEGEYIELRLLEKVLQLNLSTTVTLRQNEQAVVER